MSRLPLLGIVVIAVASRLALAADPSSGPARVVRAVAPAYSDIALQTRTEGLVTVRVAVDARGKVTDATVVEGQQVLRPPALAAARLWEFEARPRGSGSVELAFAFTLLAENACWQKALPRFVPPTRVEVAERRPIVVCHDCGPEKPIQYEKCE